MSKPVSKSTTPKVAEKVAPVKTEKPLAAKAVKPSVKKLATPKAVQPEKPKTDKKAILAKPMLVKGLKTPRKKGVSVGELITRMGMATADQFK